MDTFTTRPNQAQGSVLLALLTSQNSPGCRVAHASLWVRQRAGVCNTSRAYLERLLLLPKFNRQRFNGGHVVDMDVLSTGAWPGSYKLWKAIGRQGLKLTSSSPLSYWTFILFLVLEMTCIQYGIRYRYVALCR